MQRCGKSIKSHVPVLSCVVFNTDSSSKHSPCTAWNKTQSHTFSFSLNDAVVSEATAGPVKKIYVSQAKDVVVGEM